MTNTFSHPRYLYDREYDQVDGWLQDGAAWATFFISDYQSRIGISGDVAEIGVHHGKYFLLLCMLSNDSEISIAMDVFEDQHLNVDGSGRGDYEKFLTNYNSFDGREGKLLIHKCDSLTLSGRNLRQKGRPRSREATKHVRIFSVDGSHTAQHTRNDINVAFDVLVKKGVVVVDDFYNPHWPGVQEAVQLLLAEKPEIRAFAFGDGKLFLTNAEDHSDYFALFKNYISEFYAESKVVELHGHSAVSFTMGDPQRSIDGSMRRSEWATTFGFEDGDLVELIDGWSSRESQGVWMDKKVAKAVVCLPDELRAIGGPADVSISMYPFVHALRPSRAIRLESDACPTERKDATGGVTFIIRIPDAKKIEKIFVNIDGGQPDPISEHVRGNHDARSVSVYVSQVRFSRNQSE